MSELPDERPPQDPLHAAAGLAKLGADAYLRSLKWGAEQGLRASSRVVRAATQGEPLGALIDDAGQTVREYAREVLGVTEVERRVEKAMPAATVRARAHEERSNGNGNGNGAAPASDDAAMREALRRRGEELLTRSADVHAGEEFHPAYARILDELAPDEARILRFLSAEGAQPAIDVRTARPLDIGSQLVAPGLQMIGQQAGCRWMDRVPAYLNNLYRLGLIWFSREPLSDPLRYQVLEAQPDVIDAMKRAGRGKTVRRQIALTPFGEDFCQVCLPPLARGPQPGSVRVTGPSAAGELPPPR